MSFGLELGLGLRLGPGLENPDELFMLDENTKVTRCHCLKIRKTRCTRDIKGIFSNRVVNRWSLLDQRTVDAPSLNAFENGLSRIRDNRIGFSMD